MQRVKWEGLKRNLPRALLALLKHVDQAVIVVPGSRFQPHGILGIGRHLATNQIPEARKQVILDFSRILIFH